jgi:predicted nucleic acid-binding protein
MDRQVLDQAATLAPGSVLRSLDAIHLATAQLLGSELRSIVTYDARMAQAASGLGLSVAAPD